MATSTDQQTLGHESELSALREKLARLEAQHGQALELLSEHETHKQKLAQLNRNLLTSADIHQEDLLMAQNVQRSLLYSLPPTTLDYDIAIHYRPLAGVSGDFYDFYVDEQEWLAGLVIADVSGHGIASALYTVLAKPIFHRQFTRHQDQTLGQMLTRINAKLISQMKISDYYLTATLLRFSADVLEIASAAHPAMVLKSASRGTLRKVGCDPGAPLGIPSFDRPYESSVVAIDEGDTLVLYTDGLLESRNQDRKCYGIDSLLRVCAQCSGDSQAMLQAIISDHANFVGGEKILDDITVIVVRKNTRR